MSKVYSIKFVHWLEDNAWSCVWSEELKKRAWVDCSKHKVYVNGSDEHYTQLIKNHGKSLEELYDMFEEEMNKPKHPDKV